MLIFEQVIFQVWAGQVNWATNLEEGLTLAKEQKKPVIIDFWAEWCAVCKEIDRDTFHDETVAVALNERFICIKIDLTRDDTGEAQTLIQQYQINGLPLIVFFDSQANRQDNKWSAFGKAGLKPAGDDFFTVGLEPWRNWGNNPAPGETMFYSYHMDMPIDPKMGKYWGEMFRPSPPFVPERGRWYCMELMVKANTPGQVDGEQAFWIDGELKGKNEGIRWRNTADLKINAFWLMLYVHNSPRVNRVWFDDVAIDDASSYTTPANSPVNITLTGSDVENSSLTYSVTVNPSHGALSGTAPNLTYTPTTNYLGLDSFIFKVNDGALDSATATISITMNNSLPVAVDDAVETWINHAVAVDVLDNDSDPDSDAIHITAVNQGAHGSVIFDGSKATYSPNAGYTGSDSFTYTINDTNSLADTATVNVTVYPLVTVDAGSDITDEFNKALSLNASASGGDGSYSFSWGIVSGSNTSLTQFSNPLVQNPSFTPVLAGTYILQYTASDGVQPSATDTLRVKATHRRIRKNGETALGWGGAVVSNQVWSNHNPLNSRQSTRHERRRSRRSSRFQNLFELMCAFRLPIL